MTDDFTTFVHEAQGGAFRLALALCGGDAHEASDLLQAAFERLWARWHRLQLDDPAAYLRAVVVRTHVSRRRMAFVRRERVGHAVPDAAATPGPHEGYAEAAVLMSALAALPRRQRQAVVLRYLEDLPVAEVAELMACTTGTVKRAAHDGLRALRARLAPEQQRDEVADA